MIIAPSTLDIIDATTVARRESEISFVRHSLTQYGCAVLRLVDDEDTLSAHASDFASLRSDLSVQNHTPSGARGMGGITKYFGAGVDPRVMKVRLQPAIRHVFSLLHNMPACDLAVSMDAIALLGVDAVRASRKRKGAALSAHDAYLDATGGTLEAHVDISPGGDSAGARIETELGKLGGIGLSVQGQYIVEPVPKGGATFVYAEGDHTGPYDPQHFVVSSRDDFTPLSSSGYERYARCWRAVEQVSAGCLILWLSRTPHGNKLADASAPITTRGGVYVCWMPRALSGSEVEQRTLKKRKLEAALDGRTGDHWPTLLKKKYGGAHYSNRNDRTSVLYGRSKGLNHGEPAWTPELREEIEEAL